MRSIIQRALLFVVLVGSTQFLNSNGDLPAQHRAHGRAPSDLAPCAGVGLHQSEPAPPSSPGRDGMGDRHLHRFAIDRRRVGGRYESFDAQAHDEHGLTLRRIVAVQQTKLLYYEYDFGDGWVHELDVEKTFPPQTGMDYPICIGGARRCPPEDCGGAAEYQELLKALRDPQHPHHAETLKWVGKRFDPEAFDLERVQQELRYLRTGP